MEATLFTYALKAAITLTLLYVPYTLLLRGEKILATARTTLLAALLLSIIVPLADIPALHITLPTMGDAAIQELFTPEATAGSTITATTAPPSATFPTALLLNIIYIMVAATVAIRKALEINKIRRNIRNGTLWTEKREGYTIHCHKDETPPYSWMRHIVISEKDYCKYGKEIILHEEGHIRLSHSLDTILLAAVETIQWFNPLIYRLSDDLREIHEYQADDYVQQNTDNPKAYQMLIIKKAVDPASYTQVNSFNHSNNHLKNRITMMLKKKSNPWKGTKALYLLPATLVALSLFASPQKATGSEAENEKATSLSHSQAKVTKNRTKKRTLTKKNATPADEEIIYEVCEVLPEFPGGQKALFKYMCENIKYPEDCKKNGISGKSIVSFVIGKKGEISKVKILKSSGNKKLDNEAMRVVKAMPEWQPGTEGGKVVNVRFNIPVMFRIR